MRPERWLPATHKLYDPVFANDNRTSFRKCLRSPCEFPADLADPAANRPVQLRHQGLPGQEPGLLGAEGRRRAPPVPLRLRARPGPGGLVRQEQGHHRLGEGPAQGEAHGEEAGAGGVSGTMLLRYWKGAGARSGENGRKSQITFSSVKHLSRCETHHEHRRFSFVRQQYRHYCMAASGGGSDRRLFYSGFYYVWLATGGVLVCLSEFQVTLYTFGPGDTSEKWCNAAS